MTQRFLWNAVIVEPQITRQRAVQIRAADKARAGEYLADTPVEAFEHTVGLRMPWRDQTVFDLLLATNLVEDMRAAGVALAGGAEAVGEGLGVVGEHGAHVEGGALVYAREKASGRGGLLVIEHFQVHPARGPVDGDVQVAPGRLIGHLRQVFDVDVQVARVIGPEAAGRGVRFGCRRAHVLKPRHAVAAQAAIQARAADPGVDESAGDDRQVIKRQQQGAAQLHHDRFLGCAERRLQPVRGMGAVQRVFTRLPLAHRHLTDPVALRQHRYRFRRRP
nr:hypothetical protein [Plasticicumulans acidivorans]